MTEKEINQRMWARSKNELVRAVEGLGFMPELGEACAKMLGSPKAIDRMTAYLINARPTSEEVVVDEMLSIKSEIEAWREKKATEEANARYYDMLYRGLFDNADE